MVLAPRLLDERAAPARAWRSSCSAGTLVLRLALAAGRGGTGAWDRVFDEARSFEAANEYLPALPTVDLGPGFFLDRFAELVPSFPVHVAGHPPGLLLVMHALGARHARRGWRRSASSSARSARRSPTASRASCSTSAARGSPGC